MIKSNIKNIVYQSFAQIVPRAIMFFFVLYLARTLGSIEYGKFEFAMSLAYLVGMFFELGGNMILTKHVARNFYSSIYYAVKIRLASIVITIIIFYSILFLFNIYEESKLYIIYASIGLAFSSMMNLYFAFFRGARKMNYEAFTLLLQKVLFVALALILLFTDKSGAQPMMAFMISMAAGFFIIFTIFKKNELKYVQNDTRQEISFKDYFRDIFTLALVEVFSNIYYRLNQIFIEHFNGFEEVGIYSASYKIVEAFVNFPSILLIVLFPSFAKIAIENLKEFRVQFNKTLILLTGCGFIACIICWFLGAPILSLLGEDYGKSYVILRYLTLSLFFLFPNFLITQGLIALDKNITFAKILFTALVLNVIISIILVPQFGAAGSAISIGICEAVIFAAGYFYIRKYAPGIENKHRIPLLLKLKRAKNSKQVESINNVFSYIFPRKKFKGIPKNILVIRNDKIGDAVVTLPVIRDIKLNHPEIEVDVLVSRNNKFIFDDIDYADEIIQLDWLPEKLNKIYTLPLLGPLLQFFHYVLAAFIFSSPKKETINYLKKKNYDAVLDLVGLKRNLILAKYISGYSVGPKKLGFYFFYDYYLDSNWVTAEDDDFMTVKIEKAFEDALNLSFKKRGSELSYINKNTSKNDNPYDIIFHFGTSALRKLPLDKEKDLIEYFADKKILILDAKETKYFIELKKHFAAKSNIEFKTLDSFSDAAALCAGAKILVCYDGGQAHYLSQFVRTLTIFGPGSVALWKPYDGTMYQSLCKDENGTEAIISSGKFKNIAVYFPIWCRPCFDVGCKEKLCLQNVEVPFITDIIEKYCL